MKKWIQGTNAVVFSVAVIGIFIILTLFLNSIGTFQVDLTKNKQYTLSDQTITTLQGLDQNVEALVFLNSQDAEVYTREVTDLLAEYHKVNSKLEVKTYDLLTNPTLAKQYGVTESAVVLKKGDTTKIVPVYDMFADGAGASDMSAESAEASASYQFSGEEKLTSGLLSLSSSTTHKAYLLNGHNEFATTDMSTLMSHLKEEHITVSDLSLLQEGSIPKDANLLMIIGPQNDLSDGETKLIKQYLNNGGKLFLSLGFNEKMSSSWKNLDSLMSMYGVKDTHAVAVEPKDTSLYDPLTIIPDYRQHEITAKLAANKMYTMMSLSIGLQLEAVKGWTTTPLLTSSSNSYGETNLSGLLESKTERDTKDLAGPFDLGFAVTDAKGEPKAVILGGSTFMMDQEIVQQANLDFALNSINDLLGNTNKITIRPQVQEQYQTANLSLSQAKIIFIGTVIVFPLLFVIVGIVLWWRRRRG
ncbi:GldG family protein [Paenibacillus sp. PsM32]|uniref:GldG family protein n=1 Tax=Paenibacillus sp. PsM32 TaxID=3030536 RepID=UPI00263A9CDD|nr:GldG family protein [Paenibacillus sp. PsM32]MDN4619800.1 GldG family protein [Paenibacillus sp. PsM32]